MEIQKSLTIVDKIPNAIKKMMVTGMTDKIIAIIK